VNAQRFGSGETPRARSNPPTVSRHHPNTTRPAPSPPSHVSHTVRPRPRPLVTTGPYQFPQTGSARKSSPDDNQLNEPEALDFFVTVEAPPEVTLSNRKPRNGDAPQVIQGLLL
jgi:hypothetical protein